MTVAQLDHVQTICIILFYLDGALLLSHIAIHSTRCSLISLMFSGFLSVSVGHNCEPPLQTAKLIKMLLDCGLWGPSNHVFDVGPDPPPKEGTLGGSGSYLGMPRFVFASTPWVKKTRHQTLSHNFTNYYPIIKIFSLADSVVNLQQTHV